MEFISNSLKDTDLIAKKLAFKIKKNLENNIINYIIFLDGDLGAGKTTFTRSLVKYLGSSDNVCSPTFALVNQYKSFVDIFHFDMYR
ncbi:MAG: tRNA (adenosine(37)-N6)-threonylcarbamoyltransferase complex ATPase subunit type 1 TsaE, partial [Oscillospiraceae bacterium]|nr:tRNA (adenosine(37)-N6)-threonylcarbamoyltransferase complex ATPase subunit type 1 TsaE [Oscillospiraceae bacterium]